MSYKYITQIITQRPNMLHAIYFLTLKYWENIFHNIFFISLFNLNIHKRRGFYARDEK